MHHGVLPLYKPKGMTSHDCVMKIRRLFQTKKVGHTGTLDPEVDGVLPICIGRGTKIASYLTEAPKTYEGEVTLGISTTTEDKDGEVVQRKQVTASFPRDDIRRVLHSFLGKQTQTPPKYSAMKVKGRKLYEYARLGVEVERPKKEIYIYDISLHEETIRFTENTFSFRFTVTCSKGTYIRTLSTDIGRKLGYPAHMSDLTRIKSASFTIDECLTFTELEEMKKNGILHESIRPLKAALPHLPHIEADDELLNKIRHGQVLPAWESLPSCFLFVYDGKALAVYEQHPRKDGYIKPKTMLIVPEEG